MRRWVLAGWLAAVALAAVLAVPPARQWAGNALRGRRTVQEAIARVGPGARARLQERFAAAATAYPPHEVALVAIKDERRLELWATDTSPAWRRVAVYPIRGLSGGPGPKLREGDGQVPEGIYRITSLNPNSRFHLSMRVDYPNEFDRRMALQEGRTQPGSDIFVHGGSASIGCLAMGDEAIEELFILAHETGLRRVRLTIAPTDLRVRDAPSAGLPPWTGELYARIKQDLDRLAPPVPPAAPPEPPRR
jgi:hypothetical protein